jgi:hypothetical protein
MIGVRTVIELSSTKMSLTSSPTTELQTCGARKARNGAFLTDENDYATITNPPVHVFSKRDFTSPSLRRVCNVAVGGVGVYIKTYFTRAYGVSSTRQKYLHMRDNAGET